VHQRRRQTGGNDLAHTPTHPQIIPSLLDRCRDDVPEVAHATFSGHYHTRQEALNAIQRDLQALLNTRQAPWLAVPPDKEVGNSILMYGLADFTTLAYDEAQICLAIEAAISRFEPRLAQARVVSASRSPDGLTLQVRIEAVLQLPMQPAPTWEPASDPVNVQATLSLHPQHLEVLFPLSLRAGR
jgi:type VI secretion system protein ImpF